VLGTFSEQALSDYAEQVEKKYKEKQDTAGVQGTEVHDNFGTGKHDSTFVDENESHDPDDYKGTVGKVKKALNAKGVDPELQTLANHCECDNNDPYSNYDFTVCVRDNGTVYGTRGKCRLGKETSEDQAALLRASNRKRSRGTLGGSLKQRVARDEEATHLAGQLKDLAGERDKARKRLSAAAANLEKNKGQEEARLKYKKAQSEANQALTKYERTRSELNRRVRNLSAEQKTQNLKPRKKATKDVPDWANETGKQLG